ncbi:MAG: DUF2939 domain-containing protein [Thiohalocapsa sp.]
MNGIRLWRLSNRLHKPRRGLRRAGLLLLVALGLLLFWPYLSVWRLNERVLHDPPSALSGLVDIDSVRDQILRRLNKDADSSIGAVSDPFIQWIEQGMRTTGNETLRQSVSLEWLHGLLSARSSGDRGFLPAVRYAFFDPPDGFLVRIGQSNQSPLFVRMRFGLLGWRVSAVYY